MTGLPAQPINAELQALQHEVQRLLGRCLWGLQQYERLMKAIVASHEISMSGPPFESNQAERIADAAKKTLGALVGEFLGTSVTSGELEDITEPKVQLLESVTETEAPADTFSFKARMSLQISAEDFDRTQKNLKELVQLRNDLVHHFIDQHDLWNPDGCREAQKSLVAAYSRIEQHYEQLRSLAEYMVQARQFAAEFFLSDTYRDFLVYGIAPDGSVDWRASGIVRALREAAGELAVDGWTPVATAERWIADRHPDQLPAKYGCRSWRQVVHESRLFELRYREANGQREAWYRPRKT